jgi:hypothetical protein
MLQADLAGSITGVTNHRIIKTRQAAAGFSLVV